MAQTSAPVVTRRLTRQTQKKPVRLSSTGLWMHTLSAWLGQLFGRLVGNTGGSSVFAGIGVALTTGLAVGVAELSFVGMRSL